jgi:hypothetical protein
MTSLTTSRRGIAALVAAGVIGGGLVGVAIGQLGVAGASDGGSSTTAPRPPTVPFARGPMGRLGGPMGFAGPGRRVLHGEATVAKPGGGTMVVRFQTGRITRVAGSTVTVRSTDGYVATYTVDSGTRIVLNGADGALSSLNSGDPVRTFGVVNGTSVQAKAVLDGVPTDVRRFVRRWRHLARAHGSLARAG